MSVRRYADLGPEQRRRADCRTVTHQLVKRGKLLRLPCWICGDTRVEGHHPDYALPNAVIWLCRLHHKAHHRAVRMGNGTLALPAH